MLQTTLSVIKKIEDSNSHYSEEEFHRNNSESVLSL